MDLQLDEKTLEWRRKAREFAEEVVRPVAAGLDAQPDPEATWSWPIFEEADRRGLRQAPLRPEFGGADCDFLTGCVMLEEIAAADLGSAVVLAQHWKFAQMLQEQGTPDQLERWLGPVAADPRALLAASFTEPASGSDNILPYRAPGGGMQTRAEPVEGGWALTGMKHYISNANRARVIVCMARIDDGPLTEAVSAFIVDPTANPGVRIGRVHDKAGERLANNAEIFYEQAFVPEADVLGEHGRALANLPGLLRGSNAYAAACALGIARECFDRTLEWTRTRIGGGVPIIEHQTTGSYLADMYVNVDVARTYVYRAAWQSSNPESFDPKLGVIPKLVASERCFENARMALELWGGAGIMREHPIEKLMRDAAMWLHSDGTNIIMRLKVADQLRAATGSSFDLWDAYPAVAPDPSA